MNGPRALLARPLAERQRRPLFLLAGALVIAAALVLHVSRPEPGRPAAKAPARNPAAPGPQPDAPPAPSVDRRSPSVGLDRRELRRVERTARRFLAGYLPYAYGRAGVEGIDRRAAAPELRRLLASNSPRVSERTSRLRARVESLQTEASSTRAADVLVSVADGERRYAFPLTLERVAGRWVVSGRGG